MMEQLFDFLNQLILSANDFFLTTHIPCTINNSEGERIILEEGQITTTGNIPCDLCSRLHNKMNFKKCKKMFQQSGEQAFEFGGKYVNMCVHSLLFITVPLVLDYKHIGAMVAGPVLLISHEELLQQMVSQSEPSDETSHERRRLLETIIKTIPIITTQQSNAYLRILTAIVSSFENGKKSLLSSKSKQQSQKTRIFNYIQQHKDHDQVNKRCYPIELEESLLNAIKLGELAESKTRLDTLLASLELRFGDHYFIYQARIQELLTLITRAAITAGAPKKKLLEKNRKSNNEINKYSSINKLVYQALTHYEFCLKDINPVKNCAHGATIKKASQFIIENATTQISLEEVAKKVGLSPSYFSSIFKKERGVSFKQFLNKVRINKAKDLLKTCDFTLLEISELTGFEDQSYFCKIFKRYSGVTPAKFRQNRELMNNDTREIH